MDSNLIIDELIGGSERLAYKRRKGKKDPNAEPSFGKKMRQLFRKVFHVTKKPKREEESEPETREEMEYREMDEYFTDFNFEFPDQKPMELPPRGKKMQAVDLAEVAEVEDSVHSESEKNELKASPSRRVKDEHDREHRSSSPQVKKNPSQNENGHFSVTAPSKKVSHAAESQNSITKATASDVNASPATPNFDLNRVTLYEVDNENAEPESLTKTVAESKEANCEVTVGDVNHDTARASEVQAAPAVVPANSIPLKDNPKETKAAPVELFVAYIKPSSPEKSADSKSFDLKLDLAEQPFSVSFNSFSNKSGAQNERELAQL